MPNAVSESNPFLNIPVMRTGGSSGGASATCSITGGSAAQGLLDDYTLTTADVSWLDGDASTKNCVVTINNDGTPKSDETIQLSLINIDGATAGSPLTAQFFILASDNPGTLQFTSTAATIYRGLGGIALGVSRTGGTDGAVSSGCSVVGGDAVVNVDYVVVNSITAFGDGSSSASQVCIINPIVAPVSPGSRELVVALGGASGGALIGAHSSVTLTIIDPSHDPTCEGSIDAEDALALMRALAGYTTGILPAAPCTGDADGSLSVDIGDAVAIRRFVAAIN